MPSRGLRFALLAKRYARDNEPRPVQRLSVEMGKMRYLIRSTVLIIYVVNRGISHDTVSQCNRTFCLRVAVVVRVSIKLKDVSSRTCSTCIHNHAVGAEHKPRTPYLYLRVTLSLCKVLTRGYNASHRAMWRPSPPL
jgi:hypothetical protein